MKIACPHLIAVVLALLFMPDLLQAQEASPHAVVPGSPGPAQAPAAPQTAEPAAARAGMVDSAGRFRLSVGVAEGMGFDRTEAGRTTEGDKVTISGGGGGGLVLGAGYGISRRFDLDLDLGFQVSTGMPAPANAQGYFTRGFALVTLKYKVPTSDTGRFKFGVGAGEYFGGRSRFDVGGSPGGPADMIRYKPATGFHATAEFERFFRPTASFWLCAKVYVVEYDADRASLNGSDVPISSLKDDLRTFDGSGMDFIIGASTYF